jgi:hypothetical protein
MNVDFRLYAIVGCTLLSCSVRGSLSARAEEAEPAQRNIQFVLKDEPYVAQMPDDYQPQENLRYAAIVRGFAPLLLSDLGGADGPSLQPLDAMGLSAIAWLDSSRSGARLRELMERDLLSHQFRPALIHDYGSDIAAPRGPHVAAHGHFANMINSLNTKPHAPFYCWEKFTPAQETPRSPLQEYALLATSVEEAKQLTGDFLHAYDQGFVPWLRKLCQEQKVTLERSRDEHERKAAELDKKIASLAGEIEGIESLSEQAISDLKVKRTLLKVELAGVDARMAAIERKLKEAEGAPQLGSKLVDLKVSADIEHAGLAAQQKVLDEAINGQQRLREFSQLQGERVGRPRWMRTAAEGLPRLDEVLADLKPFQLINDTVEIRPLRFRAD